MKDFIFLFRNSEEVMKKLSAEEKRDYFTKWGIWLKKFVDEKIYEDGDRLSSTEALTIRGEEKAVFDGPYIESKEIIGGYVRIKAENIQQAAEYAKECPVLSVNGIVEIRASYEE